MNFVMLRLSTVIYVIIQCLISYPFVICEEEAWEVKSRITNEEKLIDPHSFGYDRSNKRMLHLNDLRESEKNHVNMPEESLKTKDVIQNCKTEEAFYKRLIMMLLSNAVLEENKDLVEGTIYISGTVDQFETLRKFGDGHYSFNEIDALLSELLQNPVGKDRHYLNRSYSELLSILRIIEENQQTVIIMIIASLCIFMTVKNFSMSYKFFLCCALCALFIVSFFMTWWQLINEAEIKLAVIQTRYLEMPVACQPHNMNTWEKMKSFIFGVDTKDCEKYYEARMSVPKLEVTPAIVLSHMLSSILIPVISNLGHAISKFINNSTDHLHWFKGVVQVILYLSLPAFFIAIIFYFKGGSINLGLGPLFRFSLSTHGHNQSDSDIKILRDVKRKEAIQLIREVVSDALSGPINDNKNKKNNDMKEILKLRPNQNDLVSSGGGDTASNNMGVEEINEMKEEIEKDTEINKEKDVGGGDGWSCVR